MLNDNHLEERSTYKDEDGQSQGSLVTMRKLPTGMIGFTIVWIGQFISLLGTGMTHFGLTIWAWEITGEATALALVGFFTLAPYMLMSPIAGALVDRWNRKLQLQPLLGLFASGGQVDGG